MPTRIAIPPSGRLIQKAHRLTDRLGEYHTCRLRWVISLPCCIFREQTADDWTKPVGEGYNCLVDSLVFATVLQRNYIRHAGKDTCMSK